ncbi:DUF2092 domain-containing protein [bacterium]|nr:DUF2092 domain-containing protein [bacterium]
MKSMLRTSALAFLGLCSGVYGPNLSGQTTDKSLDTRAIQVLDGMAERIGQMESCRFVVNIATDSMHFEYGPVRYFNRCEVGYSGSERFFVRSSGHNGLHGIWYNGLDMAYYDFEKKLYGLFDAPEGSSLQAIDAVHERYGVDFPAADFFFPTFTDDLIEHHDRIDYLGIETFGTRRCHHIVARSPKRNIQIWIEEDGMMLPYKMVIFDWNPDQKRSYSAEFEQWEVNPKIPDAFFDFPAPAEARPLKIVAKKSRS